MPQDVFQKLPGSVHLGVEVDLAQAGEPDVVKGVDAHLVALLVHAADHILVVLQLPPDEEKGGLHAPLGQAV